MKRAVSGVLAVLCGALLARAPAFASIVLSQTATAANVYATTNTVTFTNPVSTGDVVGVIAYGGYGAGQCAPGPSSETDSASDTPIAVTTWDVNQSGGSCVGVYMFVVSAGSSSFSITVNFASAASLTLLAFDYSGVKTSAPIDGSATAWATAANTAPATAALTPTQSGDEELAFLITGNPVTITWGGTMTQQGIYATTPQAALGGANLSSTSAVTASATLASSQPWSMAQVLLAPGSGGSSCSHDGYTAQGTLALPNGTSGSYWLKNGTLGTPNCSSVEYWQPSVGNFGVN